MEVQDRTHTHTYTHLSRRSLESTVNQMCVFFWTAEGNWKKKHPPIYGENIQTTHRKALSWRRSLSVQYIYRAKFASAYSLQEREVKTGWWNMQALAVTSMDVDALLSYICLLGVDIRLRQQARERFSSFNSSSVPFTFVLSPSFSSCLAPRGAHLHRCVCTTLVRRLNIWASAKCGSPRTLIGVR